MSCYLINPIFKGRTCALACALLFLIAPAALFAAGSVAAKADTGEAAQASLQSAAMTTDDARHLLMRTGIGADLDELVRLSGMSKADAIEDIVQGLNTTPHIDMPDWVNWPVPHYHARRVMNDNERARFSDARDAELAQLRQWWILNMLQTDSPQTERLVLFWHDVFATSYRTLNKQSLAMARQNQTFRELGSGSWEHLLKAMIRDPALLQFLDSGANNKKSPNENLARELMELFVLGEGNFTESDVQEAARALTGHDTDRLYNLEFKLKTGAQDRGVKTLFGQTGEFDGDDLIDILLEQEAAPRFLVTRFWHAFVSDQTPPSSWVDGQAQRFKESSFDIATLYRNVISSDAFWQPENRGAIIKSPVDLIVGTARTLQYPMYHWQRMPQLHRMIGMDLFAPPNVAGWSEGAAFITSGHLLNRYKISQMLTGDVQDAVDTPEQAGSLKTPSMSVPSMSVPSMSTPSMNEPDMSAPGKNEQGMSAPDMSVPSMNEPAISAPNMSAPNMSEPSMLAPNMMASRDQQELTIRLASEPYRGPAQFTLTLVRGSDVLWHSKPSVVRGHDSDSVGRSAPSAEINWQDIILAVPSEQLRDATALRVHFVNDAASTERDRNLFVDAVLLSQMWLPANRGVQHSECVPDLQAKAGMLYCNGYVELSLDKVNPDNQLTDAQAGNEDSSQAAPQYVQAASVQLLWGNGNKAQGKQVASFAFNNVQTPDGFYNVVRIRLESNLNEPMALFLDSFSCWPDCVVEWPDCARTNAHFPQIRTISLPWVTSDDQRWQNNNAQRCHFDALTLREKRLLSSIWLSLPQWMETVIKAERSQQRHERFVRIPSDFLAEFHTLSDQISNTPYAQYNAGMQVDTRYAIDEKKGRELEPPKHVINGVAQLSTVLQAQDVQLNELLLPDLVGENIHALIGDQQNARGTLKGILEHPVFQLK